jgi:hypothetical protein
MVTWGKLRGKCVCLELCKSVSKDNKKIGLEIVMSTEWHLRAKCVDVILWVL